MSCIQDYSLEIFHDEEMEKREMALATQKFIKI